MKHGRHTLPWRQTTDPYRILVSEIMLQQTQVDRVIPKYTAFIAQFPTPQALASAARSEVLTAWSGLGYNRRARFLHEAAIAVTHEYGGVFPKTYDELRALPGIGPYTAGAVLAFAHNIPISMIETNIRSVYLHEFFSEHGQVEDSELMPLIERTLNKKNPRTWYAALMDYGTHLKKTTANPSRKSKHHTKQSTFKGSRRELRGCIIRELGKGAQSSTVLAQTCNRSVEETAQVLQTLKDEQMIIRQRGQWAL